MKHFSRLCVLIIPFAIAGYTSEVLSQEAAGPAPLIERNRASLTLEGAELILKEAQAKARAMGKSVNIAVVDDGGHLVTFARMNQARPASSYTALTKAVSAATVRAATGPGSVGGEPDVLLSLSLQSAAANSGGRITSLLGGLPIVIHGQVIGAVGVGGAAGEEDVQIAQAGIDALLKKIQ